MALVFIFFTHMRGATCQTFFFARVRWGATCGKRGQFFSRGCAGAPPAGKGVKILFARVRWGATCEKKLSKNFARVRWGASGHLKAGFGPPLTGRRLASGQTLAGPRPALRGRVASVVLVFIFWASGWLYGVSIFFRAAAEAAVVLVFIFGQRLALWMVLVFIFGV